LALDVISEVTVDAPRFEVAEYAASPDNAAAWRARITGVQWISAPRLRAGSRMAFTVRVMGRRLCSICEVTEYRPGARLVMRRVGGPFRLHTVYTWEPLPDGRTRMTLRNRGRLRGIWRLASLLVAFVIRREQRKDLARLKRQVERLV
jgi:hypothetical protein